MCPVPPAPLPAAWGKREPVPTVAAALVRPLGSWEQEVRPLLMVGVAGFGWTLGDVSMGSGVSYRTCGHESWLESWLWAVRIMTTIAWVPGTCLALC